MPNDQYTLGGGRIRPPKLLDDRDSLSHETPLPSFDDLLVGTPDDIKDAVNADRTGSLAAIMLAHFTSTPTETRNNIHDGLCDLLPPGSYTLHGPFPTTTQRTTGPTVVWIRGVAPQDAILHSGTIVSDIGCDEPGTIPKYVFHLVAAQPSRESYMGFFVGLPSDATTDELLTTLKLALVGWIVHKKERATDQPSLTTIFGKVDTLFYLANASPLWKEPTLPTPTGIRIYVPKLMTCVEEWYNLRAMIMDDNLVLDVSGALVQKWVGLKCNECLAIDHTENDCETWYTDPAN
ncbi:hypothetical protein C8F01DRAFT_1113043 [Mycena amicta]|nr:hypothetical protein C8F01DRAFT_1113043 [Mycena amicta]